MGRYEEAAREFHAATEAGATGAEAYGNLGDAYRQMGRAREARGAYGRAIELAEERLLVNPKDAIMRAGLAMFLAGSGRCPDARREIRTAGVSPAPEVQYYAAVASAICGDRSEAVGHALRALEGGSVADIRTNPDLRGVREDPAVRRRLK